MVEGGSRNGTFLSEEAQCGGPLGTAALLGTLEDMLRKALDMGISLHRGLLVNLEGIRLLGLLREKDSISGFLPWTQRTFKILRMGAIWNFGKGAGLSWADIRLWATKGQSIRPRCIGTIRARTQCKSINQSYLSELFNFPC